MSVGYKILDTGITGQPDISIAMLAYNHGSYIAEAIESVLMQKTSCTYEIVIVEDYSKDNTREIALKYKHRYPQRIKLILQDKNVGVVPNSITMLTNLSGKYVAMLEGDDYWTDQNKLQKQFDFLEKNKDFSSCFTGVKILKDGKLEKDDMPEVNEVTTIYDLAEKTYIRYCTYMFRNNLIKKLPDNFQDVSGGDYFYFLLIAQHGKIKKFPEVMAVYRKHEGGNWSARDSVTRFKIMLKDLELLFNYFEGDVSRIIRERHAEVILKFAKHLVDEKKKDPNEGRNDLYERMGTNINVVLIKIAEIMHENHILKEKQKSLKHSLKNIFNITKKRLTK